MAFGWKTAGAVLGAMALMGVAIAAALLRSAPGPAILIATLAVAAAVSSRQALRRAKARRDESHARLDEAWRVVAAEVGELQREGPGAPERAAE
jgi:membrane protein implicated in regulation of membrane protease activity